QSQKEFIELAPDTITIGSGYGSTASFNVTSNISWSAASDQLWLSVSPKSSTGNQKVTVSALSANQSVSLRSAVVIVSGTGVASKQVTVIQSAGDTILTVSPSTLTVGYAEGSSIWMVVTSNTMWSVTCDQPWLTSNPVSSSGSKNVIFTANANPDGTPRTATVTITALGALSRTVTVTQVGKPMLFFANDTIRIAKEEGSKGYLAISSNVSWKATTGQPWLDIDPGSGTGEDTIEFTALTSNPTTSSRATVVTLTGVGIGYKQVTVIQEAGDTVLVASGNWADIPKEGGSVSVITVTSNVFWNAGSDQSWLDVNPEAGSGNVLLRFMAEANPTVLPRTAMVTITSPGVEPLTIEVTQAAGDAYLKVSADKVVIGAEEGDTAIIEIQSNTTWNVASEEDWLTVDPQTGTGNDTLVFTAQANPSDIDRPVYVEITAGEDQTRTILVVQMAGTVGNELIEDKPISVYPNPVAEGFRVEGIEGQTEVVVTDLSGRVYLKTVVNGNEYIPAATLAKGVYLIRISGRTIFTEKKLVKL
ncbi:MAG TPA: BACON domain-containing carbohydrate-binding protein, partial [Prolixibacteraceae bacterium]|nr:BACON domain-containing carbohydrate-binding protein [Prolixibacteraceae bacterium]